MMMEEAHPDCSSVSEVDVHCDNQNMIVTVGVRPNADDNFLSREWNCAHLACFTKRMVARSQLF
jgi:hypothetical protein